MFVGFQVMWSDFEMLVYECLWQILSFFKFDDFCYFLMVDEQIVWLKKVCWCDFVWIYCDSWGLGQMQVVVVGDFDLVVFCKVVE